MPPVQLGYGNRGSSDERRLQGAYQRSQEQQQPRQQYRYREPQPRDERPQRPQEDYEPQFYDVPKERQQERQQVLPRPQQERRRVKKKVLQQKQPIDRLAELRVFSCRRSYCRMLTDGSNTFFVQEPAAPAAEEFYKPASGPAYATATNVDELERLGAAPRLDNIPYPSHGSGAVPADQRSLEEAVINGANGFQPEVAAHPPNFYCAPLPNMFFFFFQGKGGVYQKEDRLEFQIHGHQGPHSYRYGYDTGNG